MSNPASKIGPAFTTVDSLRVEGNPTATPNGWWNGHGARPDKTETRRVFRNCVICGKDRFPNTWNPNGVDLGSSSCLTTCDSPECWKKAGRWRKKQESSTNKASGTHTKSRPKRLLQNSRP